MNNNHLNAKNIFGVIILKTNLFIKILMVGLCASLLAFSFAGCSKEDMSSTGSKVSSMVSDVKSDVNSFVGNDSGNMSSTVSDASSK